KGLKHRHIAQLFDVLEERGELVVVQELVRGHTLLQEIDFRGGSLPLPRIYTIFRQILAAVGHAHSTGILHMALNPNKIMISRSGEDDRIKILDFGLGPYHDKGSEQSAFNVLELDVQQGFYLSPEQLHKAMGVSEKSDLYSIGILLYEGATGYVPFGAENIYGVIRGHLLDRPEPPSNLQPEVPWYLGATILKALAKHPDDRFEDARDFGYHIIACQTEAVIPLMPKKVKVARVRSSSPEMRAVSPDEGEPDAAPAATEEAGGNGRAAGAPSREGQCSEPRVSVQSVIGRLRQAPGQPPPPPPPPSPRGDQLRPDATVFVRAVGLAEQEEADRPSRGRRVEQLPELLEVGEATQQVQAIMEDSDPRVPVMVEERTPTERDAPTPSGKCTAVDAADSQAVPAAAPSGRGAAATNAPSGRNDPAGFERPQSGKQAQLPRGLAQRELKPLPEGVVEPSYLALLRIRTARRQEEGASSESPLTTMTKLGFGRSGFKRP
ncbi:MAG: serine/threonine protein kinase, partial [Deltaproteobacteria bacterium]|nr:serine/threonine protein kinase [Deltaproteobacteria bacterium]